MDGRGDRGNAVEIGNAHGTDSLIAISRDHSKWGRPCADDVDTGAQRGHQDDRYGSRPPLESQYS